MVRRAAENLHEEPSLVVLDLMLPQMDGWKSAAVAAESDVPIIAVDRPQ
ncbi:MAG: hypothetical protein IPO91_34240 [Chloroflexi bacterium]|nr:hypothetical protein [Chloroflexota bacterium]